MKYNFIFMFSLYLLGMPLVAATQTSQAHSKATIITDKSQVRPGDFFRVGIKIELDNHWHTYWKNPGDSGAAPILNVKTSPSVAMGELFYPLPKRILVGPLVSFGYEKETLLFYELQVPKTVETLGNIQVSMEAEWLVCKEECIPAFFEFETTVDLGKTSEKNEYFSLFEHFHSTIHPENSLVKVKEDQQNLTLMLALRQEEKVLDIFPFPEMFLSHHKPEMNASPRHLEATFKKHSKYMGMKKFLLVSENNLGIKKGTVLLEQVESEGIWLMFGLAFVGGLILNLMPCVFPVLTLKIFTFVKAGQDKQYHLIRAQLVYVLGILVSFWIIAAGIYAFRVGGNLVGWGFQMQNPWFVTSILILFFILGLNFIGFWEYSGYGSGIGQNLANQSSYWGSFFTGMLAVVVASPCTAPFMGAALGYALSQNLLIAMLIFTALGLGLGAPYLLLAAVPKLGTYLPRPGPWMVTIKEFMAFPMWATCIWLLSVLQSQIEDTGIIALLATILLITLAIRIGKGKSRIVKILVGFVLIGLCWPLLAATFDVRAQQTVSDSFWQEFQPRLLHESIGNDFGVFVNFTASWCISCQVNDRTTFRDPAIRGFVEKHKIKMIKADWTNQDQSIGKILQEYQRVGVPLYLYFPPFEKQARILPEILTPDIFISYIQNQ